MKIATPFLLVISAAFNFSSWSDPEQSKGGDICGYYSSRGSDADGNTYVGVAMIRKVEESYIVTWIVDEGNTVGIGMRHGDFLSVGWMARSGSSLVRGVTVYKIDSEKKTMSGSWMTLPGPGVMLEENLEFLRSLDPLAKKVKKKESMGREE